MSENKKTVEWFMDGFRKSDHAQILSCLTEDIVWDLPGAFHFVGKEAFDKEIENPAFTGRPDITVTRLIEEHDTVVAEGSVRVKRASGEMVSLVFCDVFEMRQAKVRRLISYLVEVKAA